MDYCYSAYGQERTKGALALRKLPFLNSRDVIMWIEKYKPVTDTRQKGMDYPTLATPERKHDENNPLTCFEIAVQTYKNLAKISGSPRIKAKMDSLLDKWGEELTNAVESTANS